MDIRKIRKLIELIDETGVREIEIKEGEESVRISRGQVTPTQTIVEPLQYAPPPIAPTAPAVAPPEPDRPLVDESTAEPATNELQGHVMKAPMVGTLYIAPSPASQNFVETGQHVKKGDVVCIIEAMKMMNQIEADCDGIIKARLVDNGEPVEFGQPLYIIEEQG